MDGKDASLRWLKKKPSDWAEMSIYERRENVTERKKNSIDETINLVRDIPEYLIKPLAKKYKFDEDQISPVYKETLSAHLKGESLVKQPY